MSDLQIRSIIERILRLHAESDELAADIREVYGEAKTNGYDKTALGAAVRAIRQRDKIGEAAIAERETVVGLYLAAYDGASHVRVGAPAREAMPTYPERATRPATDLETSKDSQARQISAPAGNGADQLVTDDPTPIAKPFDLPDIPAFLDRRPKPSTHEAV